MSRNLKGISILLMTALLWGFTFPAQRIIASHNIGAFTLNFLRCAIASVMLGIILAIRSGISKKEGRKKEMEKPTSRMLAAGLICGAFLAAGINLQQFGLQFYPNGIASSGRAGFLTSTYVVLVALLSVFFGKKVHPITFFAGGLCMIGMYLLCMGGDVSRLYLGDVLMLLDACGFAAQIMAVDYFSEIDGMTLSFLQFVVCTMISLVGMLLFEHFDPDQLREVIFPLLYCGIGASGGGFTLQIIGQKYADPAPASIAMSMESVFSGLGGWIILGETMNGRELTGCALVFTAVILTQIPQFFVSERADSPGSGK